MLKKVFAANGERGGQPINNPSVELVPWQMATAQYHFLLPLLSRSLWGVLGWLDTLYVRVRVRVSETTPPKKE